MYRWIKRGFDLIVSLVAMLILSPLVLVLMVIIRAESPGSPIFAQTRVGRGGRPFTIYKLRTMHRSAPSSVATGELAGASAYITRFGGFLRRSSLDELPQFINIFRGDMSLVGPRPLVPEETDVHEERLRLGVYDVRPGVTGWAQVNGRDLVNAGKKAELDQYYAQHVSLALDARIVFRTAVCVLTGKGIQEGAREEQTNDET